MATDRIRYVNRDSAGGDGTTNALAGANAAFRSISLALEAEYALDPDLVASDLRLIIECEGDTQDPDNVNFSDHQFTTDATRYVLIRVSGIWRHQGVYSMDCFRMVPSTTSPIMGITNIDCRVHIEGLQINIAGSLTSALGISLLTGGTGILVLDSCILKASGSTGTPGSGGAIMGAGVSARQVWVKNCLFEGPWFRGIQLSFLSGGGRLVAYHNTFVGTYRNAIFSDSSGSGRVFLKNNRVDTLVSPGQSFSLPGTTPTTGGNFTADAFSPDDASHENKTFVFAGGGSYLLASDDGFEGADLSADATFPVSTDVLGTTRVDFHAGFHEFAAGGPSYHDLNGVLLQSDALGSGGGGGGGVGANLIGGGLAR